MEPIWLTSTQIRMLHAESLHIFGGAPGLREEGLLESALDRPRNKWLYEEDTSLFALAASYAFAIARNHPFVDGNKRASVLAIRAFLSRNGLRFSPNEPETVAMIEGLAAGEIDEPRLGEWIQSNSRPAG